MSARLVIVFVVDGLRPDAIAPDATPALWRLRAEGVEFTNSHAVCPTVTRVNAATLATGTQPGTHGIVGNQVYVPAADPVRAIGTDSHRRLLDVDRATGGRLVQTPTLAERLHARGLALAAVSSGSTGSALLTNPQGPRGVGALVNGYFDPGVRVAWPDAANEAILAKFGPAPPRQAAASYDAAVTWTQRVLREHVLPELAPALVINWITEPDHSQHVHGVGSPAARAALRHADGEIAQDLSALEGLGLLAATAVFVASDHGFTSNARGIDVAGELVAASLKDSPTSTDVVLASSGQAVALHVAGHDGGRISRIARLAMSRDWGGVLFTAARGPGDPQGAVDGTFALELIHLANPERSPDLLVTFPWTSEDNAFGAAGMDLACVSGGAKLYASDHGSMSPWNVRSTLLGWGAGFRRGISVAAPVGNADVAPTALALLGIEEHVGMEGRVLAEALDDGPPVAATAPETHTVASGSYRASVQISTADGRRYVDESRRTA